MIPHERSLVNKLAGKPFALLGVNSDKDLAAMRAKYPDEQITWRSFWCGPDGTRGPIPTRWNVRGWPTLYLLDHAGVIRHKWVGNPGDKVLDAAIDELVAAAEAAQK